MLLVNRFFPLRPGTYFSYSPVLEWMSFNKVKTLSNFNSYDSDRFSDK